MTREEVKTLLNKLNLTPTMDYEDIEYKIRTLGYNQNQIKVESGSSKICLVFDNKTDFIVKWTYDSYNNKNNQDESVKECIIYIAAKAEKLEFFFPKTEIFGQWGGVTVVIQDKVDYSVEECSVEKLSYYQHISQTVTNKIFLKMENDFQIGSFYDRELNPVWGKLVISLYGKKITKKLCKFIQKYGINDLHSENIGYKNDKPVILDFSGYYR